MVGDGVETFVFRPFPAVFDHPTHDVATQVKTSRKVGTDPLHTLLLLLLCPLRPPFLHMGIGALYGLCAFVIAQVGKVFRTVGQRLLLRCPQPVGMTGEAVDIVVTVSLRVILPGHPLTCFFQQLFPACDRRTG